MSFDVPKLVPDELKQAYGVILAREPDPWKAALILCPSEMSHALYVNDKWRADPEVLAHRDKERDRIADEEAATKADLKREVWAMATNSKVDPKDRAAYMKLYAELIGAIEKVAPVQVNNNNVVAPKVIAIPTYQSDAEWEAEAAKQQQELLNVATSRH